MRITLVSLVGLALAVAAAGCGAGADDGMLAMPEDSLYSLVVRTDYADDAVFITFNQALLTNLRSTSLSPAWNPTDSSVAFTSYFKGYPFLFRLHPFNPRRRGQDPELLSAWPGINTAPAWAPDGEWIGPVAPRQPGLDARLARPRLARRPAVPFHR